MALMPEDLQNKRFTPVRFSEGYDMDEVDNYLDNDVMPRLQELIDENSRLTKELEEAHNRIAQLEAGVGDDTVAEDADAADEPVALAAEAEETEAPAAVEEPAPAAAAPQDAAGIIALANRLHDEHVKNGEDKRDQLISDAENESARPRSTRAPRSRTSRPRRRSWRSRSRACGPSSATTATVCATTSRTSCVSSTPATRRTSR